MYHPESDYFQNSTNDAFPSLNKWFKVNQHTLKFDKTNIMKFSTNNKTCINLNISYDNKTTEETGRTKFTGLQTDNNLNWKKHIRSACSSMRTVTAPMKTGHFDISFLCLFSFHTIWS
jgi:hypothetical protein